MYFVKKKIIYNSKQFLKKWYFFHPKKQIFIFDKNRFYKVWLIHNLIKFFFDELYYIYFNEKYNKMFEIINKQLLEKIKV